MKDFDKIILIDDDPIFSSLTKESLGKLPLGKSNVLRYLNGVRALRDFGETDLKKMKLLMFIDITMPIMDGWEFLNELENVGLNTENEIYILSSSVREEDKERALSYTKVKDYIPKPLSSEVLRKIVSKNQN